MLKKSLGWMAYLLFLAVFFEVSFRILFSMPQFIYRLPFDDAFEVKWYYWWLNRQKEGYDIYFNFDVHDETKGWALQPNLANFPSEYNDTSMTSNSAGLRMSHDVTYENPDGTLRIMTVGDSFTFGEHVDDEDNYPYILQERLPEVEVINLGIHGYGNDQMLIFLEEEGLKYEPDIVILSFVSTDVPRNVLSFRDFAKPMFVLEDGELVLTNTPVPSPEEVLAASYYRSRTLDVAGIFYDIYRQRSGLLKQQEAGITAAILDEQIRQIEAIGAIPIVVYMPFGEEITEDLVYLEWEQFMFDYCDQDKDLHCTTLRPEFAAGLNNGIVYDMGHWQRPGHVTVADGLVDYLISNDLVETEE